MGEPGHPGGNGCYSLLSAAGLSAALLTSQKLLLAMRYLGAGYLTWLGVKTMLGRGLALPALLPQFIRTARSISLQVLVLAITAEAIELLVLVRYGVAAGRIAKLVRTVSYL